MKIALKSMFVVFFIAIMLFLNIGTYAKSDYVSRQSRVKAKEMERIENISKTLHGNQTKTDDMGLAWSSEIKAARVDLTYNGKVISHFTPRFSYVYNEDLAGWFKDFEGREVTLILYSQTDVELLRVNYKIVPMVEPKPEEASYGSSKPDETIKAIEETVEPCPLGMGDDHSPSMQD